MWVSPPWVNQMVRMLERKGMIQRQRGQARSLRVIVPEDKIPPWNKRTPARSPAPAAPAKRLAAPPTATPANLYVLSIFLESGPVSEKLAKTVINRVIEIRVNQTPGELHD